MQDYYGKLVYITGGSSGIGLALGIRFARLGADIAIFVRNRHKLETAATQIKNGFPSPEPQVHGFVLDVSDEKAVTETMANVVDVVGVPDILILCAGETITKPFGKLQVREFNQVIQTNLLGSVAPIAALLPEMAETGGALLLVSSLGGLIGAYGYSAYSSSKFAQVGLGEVLRWEFAKYNINVSVLCPPEVATPFLEYEKETIPIETRTVKDLLGTLSPDYVAERAIKGLERNKFLIIPGFRARSMYLLSQLLPRTLLQKMSIFSTEILIKIKQRLKK